MEMTKSLFISNVEDQFTPECIVNLFYNEGIADISRITLLPEDKFIPLKNYNWTQFDSSTKLPVRFESGAPEARPNSNLRWYNIETMDPNKKYNKAYIEVVRWHDTVRAYNILACLDSMTYKPIMFYDENNCWEIKINKRPSICYNPIHKKYTTVFVPSPLLYDASGNDGIGYISPPSPLASPQPLLPPLQMLPLLQNPFTLPPLQMQQLPLNPYMYYPGSIPPYSYPTHNNLMVPFY